MKFIWILIIFAVTLGFSFAQPINKTAINIINEKSLPTNNKTFVLLDSKRFPPLQCSVPPGEIDQRQCDNACYYDHFYRGGRCKGHYCYCYDN